MNSSFLDPGCQEGTGGNQSVSRRLGTSSVQLRGDMEVLSSAWEWRVTDARNFEGKSRISVDCIWNSRESVMSDWLQGFERDE